MATPRRMRFVRGQVAWMVAVVLVLSVLGSVSYERFFLLSVLGLLVVTGLTAPVNSTPAWRERLKWLIAAALVVFVGVVVRRFLVILPSGVTPL